MQRRPLILAIPALLSRPARADPPAGFIGIVPTEGGGTVALAAAQVVRVGRAEGHTVIDTAAWVQQRTVESVDSVAARLAAAGARFIPLTDLANGRIYLAADRIVLVRESGARHAAGARAAIVMVGLRFGTDVAVRESAEEVLVLLGR
ncbi:hypothetical protein [Falsiroseomonas sp. HW251]|uniref:hypothetical protein n=1 Tax=Falsiroseomonas sp. HW251 TaxID=3390998 RepID=UPI003D3193E0